MPPALPSWSMSCVRGRTFDPWLRLIGAAALAQHAVALFYNATVARYHFLTWFLTMLVVMVCSCTRSESAGSAALSGPVGPHCQPSLRATGLHPASRGCKRYPHEQRYPPASRNGLTNYGDRDFSLYLRRSFAQSMGYSARHAGKAGGRHRLYAVRLQQLPPAFPRNAGGGETRRAGGRRAADRISHHLARRGVSQSDQPEIPQSDVDGHRGDGARAADGRGGADGRLRQDRAGPAHGRGVGRPAGDHAGGGAR